MVSDLGTERKSRKQAVQVQQNTGRCLLLTLRVGRQEHRGAVRYLQDDVPADAIVGVQVVVRARKRGVFITSTRTPCAANRQRHKREEAVHGCRGRTDSVGVNLTRNTVA